MKSIVKRVGQSLELTNQQARGFILLMALSVIVAFLPYLSQNLHFQQTTYHDQQELDSILASIRWHTPEAETEVMMKTDSISKDTLKRQTYYTNKKSKPIVKLDLNQCTAIELQEIRGIGPVLSERIIKFRNMLGGFGHPDQLYDVYGLDSSLTAKVISTHLSKQELTPSNKININHDEFKTILAHPYLKYDAVKAIFNMRNRQSIRPEDFDSLISIEDYEIHQHVVHYIEY